MEERGHDGAEQAARLRVWLLGLYLAFVVYGSLVPLHFVPRPLDEAIATFSNIPFLQLGIGSRADWVANLLLFIPLSFLAALALTPAQGVGRVIVAALIVVAGVALAVGIEFVQLFFPNRTVSQNDILAEGLGGLIGVLCHGFWGERVGLWIEALWRAETRRTRQRKLLHAYLLVLLGFNVLPLDLTLSPAEMYHKWQAGRIVLLPFGAVKGGLFQAAYELATDALVWVPVGLLWAGGRSISLAAVVWRGVQAAFVVEVLQLFIFSRFTDVTDILLAAVGTGLGAAAAGGGRNYLASLWAMPPRTWWRLWWAWLLLALCVFWFPFSFSLDGVSAGTALTAFTRLPFATYYGTTEFHAINELLRKVGFFLPGGLLWGMAAVARSDGARLARGVAPLAAVAVLVEAGQLFIPGKVADLTDALLESSGAALGLLIVHWVRAAGDAEGEPAPGGRGLAAPVSAVRELLRLPAGPWIHVLWVGTLALLIAACVRFPGVPYNVRELVAPGLPGMLSAAGLALAIYWMANAPFLMLAAGRGPFPLRLPLLLIGHGLVSWFLLRLAVPMESIDDIVGSPVLDWPWEWEPMARYLALHAALVLQVVAAASCVLVVSRPAVLPQFLYVLTLSLALSWPLHSVVVSWAATDNLTELMRDGGSYLASTSLAVGFFMTCLCGSALAAVLAGGRRAVALLVLAAGAAPLAAAAFWLGAEPAVVKYGKVFSAFQFLLSADRQHYAHGAGLLMRYLFAFALVAGGLAALQVPSWIRQPAGRPAIAEARRG